MEILDRNGLGVKQLKIQIFNPSTQNQFSQPVTHG